MSVQHTPGPWRIGFRDETEEEAVYNYDAITVTQDTDRLIPKPVCEIDVLFFDELPEDGSTFHERAIADARLIAAAPDLLASVATDAGAPSVIASVPDLMEYAAEYFDDYNSGRAVQHALRTRASIIRAAIAKAEGRES